MAYRTDSLEARLLAGNEHAIGEVLRWIAEVLTLPRFWSLRSEWRDLHQEVLTRTLESLKQERFDASRDFKSYVRAVTRYTALESLSLRRRRLAANDLGERAEDEASSVENRLWARQLVRRVMETASPECRDLIRAYFVESRSYAEIAADTGVPEGTVKSRLFRCLQTARRRIGKSHGRARAGSSAS